MVPDFSFDFLELKIFYFYKNFFPKIFHTHVTCVRKSNLKHIIWKTCQTPSPSFDPDGFGIFQSPRRPCLAADEAFQSLPVA